MPTRIRTLLTGFAGGLCMLTIASIVAPTITSGQQAVGVGPESGLPIQRRLCVALGAGCGTLGGGEIPGSFAVPGFVRMVVVESVNGTCRAPSTIPLVILKLQTSTGGVTGSHPFPLQFAGQATGVNFSHVSFQGRLYADGGTQLGLGLSGGPGTVCDLMVSGYYIERTH